MERAENGSWALLELLDQFHHFKEDPQGGSNVTQKTPTAAKPQKEEEEEKLWEEQEGGAPEWKCSIPAAIMTDAEAQSAPPSAPVEDKPQAERKVIGGLYKVNFLV